MTFSHSLAFAAKASCSSRSPGRRTPCACTAPSQHEQDNTRCLLPGQCAACLRAEIVQVKIIAHTWQQGTAGSDSWRERSLPWVTRVIQQLRCHFPGRSRRTVSISNGGYLRPKAAHACVHPAASQPAIEAVAPASATVTQSRVHS